MRCVLEFFFFDIALGLGMTKISVRLGPYLVLGLSRRRFRGETETDTGIPDFQNTLLETGRGWYCYSIPKLGLKNNVFIFSY